MKFLSNWLRKQEERVDKKIDDEEVQYSESIKKLREKYNLYKKKDLIILKYQLEEQLQIKQRSNINQLGLSLLTLMITATIPILISFIYAMASETSQEMSKVVFDYNFVMIATILSIIYITIAVLYPELKRSIDISVYSRRLTVVNELLKE